MMVMMTMKAMMMSIDDDDQCSDFPQLDQSLWVRPVCKRPLRRSPRWTHHFAGVKNFEHNLQLSFTNPQTGKSRNKIVMILIMRRTYVG